MPGTNELPKRYLGIAEGVDHRHTNIPYASLATELRTRVDAVDLTEHELLEMIVITMNKINIHLMAGSDIDLMEDDKSWP